MTPKEKAKSIYEKMEVDVMGYDTNFPRYSFAQAKACSLVMVIEIIEELKEFGLVARIDFWNEVKSELEAFK